MDYLEPDKIYNEDCISGIGRIRANSVDLLVTEPLYPVNFQDFAILATKPEKRYPNRYGLIPEEDYHDFSTRWLLEVWRAMSSSASGFIFCHWKNLRFLLNAINRTRFRLVNHSIWRHHVPSQGERVQKQFVPIHSHILYITKLPLTKDKSRVFHRIPEYSSSKGKLYFEDVWNQPLKSNNDEYNQSVGYLLIEKCIRIGSNEGDLVLDPFMTSNSLPMACIHYKRAFIGFSVSERDFEVIQEQLALGNPEISRKNG
jgi:site-specific DNA-methyltransferase (adenine-specific)